MQLKTLHELQDGALQLAELAAVDPHDSRRWAIEEAYDSVDPKDFLATWVKLLDFREDPILAVKLWFSLDYVDLSDVFGVEPREVAQRLRGHRIQKLGKYAPVEGQEIAGLSCFLVEQYFSPYVDLEVREMGLLTQIERHLAACLSCRERLAAYRELQQSVLQQRRPTKIISDDEWTQVLQERKLLRRRFWTKMLLALIVLLSVSVILVWVLSEDSEKIPNVYEYHEAP